MPDPTVCAILLTKDRPEYARRAVEAFRAQTYDPCKRFLLIYDSGDPSWFYRRCDSENEQQWTPQGAQGATIGALRNSANNSAGRCDIFVHFDSDDYSHPNRIAEQVALLQASGADCVGYREVLFWDTQTCASCDSDPIKGCEADSKAYLYTNNDPRYVIGSSMCYWRACWEKLPFEDVAREEDGRWWRAARDGLGIGRVGGCVGVTGLLGMAEVSNDDFADFLKSDPLRPRMICRVHAGNAKHYDMDRLVVDNSAYWRRVPEFDATCRAVME